MTSQHGPLPQPLTNPREVAGFFIVHLVRIASFLLLGYTGALVPLYGWAYRIGHGMMLAMVSLGVSLIAMLVMLPLFLLVRGVLGGTPALVSGVGGGRAIASSGVEIGAYFLAQLIGIVALTLLSGLILSPLIYAPLIQGGHTILSPAIANTIGLVIAAAVLLIFVSLRRAFASQLPR